jgi:hypothetical protein
MFSLILITLIDLLFIIITATLDTSTNLLFYWQYVHIFSGFCFFTLIKVP